MGGRLEVINSYWANCIQCKRRFKVEVVNGKEYLARGTCKHCETKFSYKTTKSIPPPIIPSPPQQEKAQKVTQKNIPTDKPMTPTEQRPPSPPAEKSIPRPLFMERRALPI